MDEKQRAILLAIGWYIDRYEYVDEEGPQVSYCLRDASGTRRSIAKWKAEDVNWPNLSDLSVSLPLLDEWCWNNEVTYEIHMYPRPSLNRAESYSCTVNRPHAPEERGASLAEAVINAWHSALKAMGRI